jgi:hypothetical protein
MARSLTPKKESHGDFSSAKIKRLQILRPHQKTTSPSRRLKFLKPLTNNLSVRLHITPFAVTTLGAFMAIPNYGDTLSVNTRYFAEFGYAKKIR